MRFEQHIFTLQNINWHYICKAWTTSIIDIDLSTISISLTSGRMDMVSNFNLTDSIEACDEELC